MNTLKQYGYLIAIFAMFFVMLFLFSLSYCGGKADGKMDARDIIIEQKDEEIKRLESAVDVSQSNTLKAIENATKYKYDYEIKSYQYDSLRKVKPKVIYRNLDVYDDSLVNIWTNQNKE